jgi:iron(III) transport system substrate-binding protein
MSRKITKKDSNRKSLGRRSFLKTTGMFAGAAAFGAPFIKPANAAKGFTWYSASSARSVSAWVEKFQKKTNIPTKFIRAGGVKLAQKFEAEIKANQLKCSVIDTSLPGLMMNWVERGLIMPYDSPEAKNYPDDIRDPGLWSPTKGFMLVIAYNADIIKPEDAPKNFEDVLDPKWKGKMVMADAFYSGASLHWYAAMEKALGGSFMDKLGKQDVLLRRGHGATANTVTSGERPLAPMLLHYRVFAANKKGANLRLVIPKSGVPVGFMVSGIPKGAPNPEAGKKFIDFSLSKEAQTLWQRGFNIPSMRKDIEPLSRKLGRRPLSEIKRINSSAADIRTFFGQQKTLMASWSERFK